LSKILRPEAQAVRSGAIWCATGSYHPRSPGRSSIFRAWRWAGRAAFTSRSRSAEARSST
jgi:hypothetical protein